jgi:hypothetical protein
MKLIDMIGWKALLIAMVFALLAPACVLFHAMADRWLEEAEDIGTLLETVHDDPGAALDAYTKS